jgi:hypothetical protein
MPSRAHTRYGESPTTGYPRYEIQRVRMIVLTSTKILQAKTEEETSEESGKRTEEGTG